MLGCFAHPRGVHAHPSSVQEGETQVLSFIINALTMGVRLCARFRAIAGERLPPSSLIAGFSLLATTSPRMGAHPTCCNEQRRTGVSLSW